MVKLEYKIFIHDLETNTYQTYDDRVYNSIHEANKRKHNYLNRIDTRNYELCVRIIPKEEVEYKIISENISGLFPNDNKSVVYRTNNYEKAKDALDHIYESAKRSGLLNRFTRYYIEKEV